MPTKVKDIMLEGTGLYSLFKRVAAEAGLNLVSGSFEEGGTLSNINDVLLHIAEARYYSWGIGGTKEVPAGSTPSSTGGIGAGAWVDRTDATLRSDMNVVVRRYSSVADMIADTSLVVGQIVETLGYYGDWVGTANKPKGGNRYEIVAGATGTSDDGSFIGLSNGLQAKGLFVDGIVNVCQFGAKGDGVTDDTVAIQKSIDFCGSTGTQLNYSAGTFNVSSTLTVSSSKPLKMVGQSLSITESHGTIISLTSTSMSLFNVVAGIGSVQHSFEQMKIINSSGGSLEDAFYSRSPVYSRFKNISISGFNYGFRFQRTLFVDFDSVFVDNCSYGISCYNITEVTPLVLNVNYYNNLVSIRNCQITDSNIGIKISGAIISIVNTDISRFTTYGIDIGNPDSANQFNIDGVYLEGGTGTPIRITNGIGTIGELFLGQTFTTGMMIINGRITVQHVYAYAKVSNLIDNNGGRVWLGDISGEIITAFTNSNSGTTFYQYRQQPKSGSVGLLTYGTSSNLTSIIRSGTYHMVIRMDDNGTTRFQSYIVYGSVVKKISMEDTPSTYLTVTSTPVGDGTYTIVFTNTAGFVYNINIGMYSIMPISMIV